MKDTKPKFRKIMNSVIADSYSWLKLSKLWIINLNLGKYSMGVFWLLPHIRIVFINPTRVQGKDDFYLRGLFAHELAHFERDRKKGWIKYLGYYILLLFSPKITRQDERETDKLTIAKGYGKNIYNVSKNRAPEKRKYYLSPAEIKSYAKQIGKW